MLRAARAEMGVPLAIMLDTKGPEVRMFGYSKPVLLSRGDTLYIESTDKAPEDIPELPAEDRKFFTNLPLNPVMHTVFGMEAENPQVFAERWVATKLEAALA